MVSKIVKELLLLHRKADLEFLFRDDFITAEASFIALPRTTEPGPGTLVGTQTGGSQAIVAGQLEVVGANSTSQTILVSQDSFARTAGLCAMLKTISGVANSQIGINYEAGGTWDRGTDGKANDGSATNWDGGSLNAVSGVFDNFNAIDRAVFVLRNTGALLICQVGNDFILRWVFNEGTLTPVYISYNQFQVGATNIMDDWRVSQLPSPWDTDDGIATSTLDGARSAGDTFTHEADCLIEFIATTIPSGDQIEMRFRIQDATNFWQVTIDSAGDIDLDEVVAGTPTERGTAAAVIANGDRVVIIADDETIKVYEANVLRITYSSAANFKTETDGELETEGTGGSVSDIKAWPRLISGGPLNQLNAVANA